MHTIPIHITGGYTTPTYMIESHIFTKFDNIELSIIQNDMFRIKASSITFVFRLGLATENTVLISISKT